jgi:hypothetical protein
MFLEVEEKKLRYDPLCRSFLNSFESDAVRFKRIFFIGASANYVYDNSADRTKEIDATDEGIADEP